MVAEAGSIHDEKTPLRGRFCFCCSNDFRSDVPDESLGNVRSEVFEAVVVGREGGELGKVILAVFQGFAEGVLVQVLDRGDGENQGIVVCSRSSTFGVGRWMRLCCQVFPGEFIQSLWLDGGSSHSASISGKRGFPNSAAWY